MIKLDENGATLFGFGRYNTQADGCERRTITSGEGSPLCGLPCFLILLEKEQPHGRFYALLRGCGAI